MSTLRDRLLAALNSPVGSYPLPDGFVVHLRRWSLADWLAFESCTTNKSELGPERTAIMLSLCVADSANAILLSLDDARTFPFGEHAWPIIERTLELNRGDRDPKKPATQPPTSAPTPS